GPPPPKCARFPPGAAFLPALTCCERVPTQSAPDETEPMAAVRPVVLRLTGNSYCGWEQRRSGPVSRNADPAAGYYRSVARGCRGSYSPTSPPPGRCQIARGPPPGSGSAGVGG